MRYILMREKLIIFKTILVDFYTNTHTHTHTLCHALLEIKLWWFKDMSGQDTWLKLENYIGNKERYLIKEWIVV